MNTYFHGILTIVNEIYLLFYLLQQEKRWASYMKWVG